MMTAGKGSEFQRPLEFLEAHASQGLVLSVAESVCLSVCLRVSLRVTFFCSLVNLYNAIVKIGIDSNKLLQIVTDCCR